MGLICGVSSVIVDVPNDLRSVEARQDVLSAIQELGGQFLDGFPKLDPIKVLF